MAPSNLNQVLINNATTMLTSGAFAQNAAAASSSIGIWDLGAATPAYGTNLLNAGAIVPNKMQFTQTMVGGNPLASPIIEKGDIARIAYSTYQVSQRHTVALTAAAVTAGDYVSVKLAIRTMPTAYAYYATPNDGRLDLSGGNRVFPLLGNFSAGRTLISLGQVNSATDTVNATAIANAISGDVTLDKIFSVSVAGAVVTIVARHAGVVFDVTCVDNDGVNPNWTQSTTGWDAGVGNYWQVISDELSQRARYGNFNRMYFPMSFDTFAVSTNTYNVTQISYAHAHPSSTGIARAAELNTVKLYTLTAQAGIATELGVTFPAAGVTTEVVF